MPTITFKSINSPESAVMSHPDGREASLGFAGEISLLNPVVVAGIFLKHVGGELTFIFAEVDYLAVLVVVDKTTGKVYILLLHREIG